MILRSLTKHVKDQNWFAVGLDFAIVVFGVFIGIQVSNWNTDRVENKLEQGYLVRLHEDFSDSSARTLKIVRDLDFQSQAQDLVVRTLASCELTAEAADTFELGIYSLGFINPPRLVRRTIDELEASGRLNLIQSEELKAELAAAITDTEFRAAVTDSVLRRAERHRSLVEEFVFYEKAPTSLRYDLQEMCRSKAAMRAVSAIRAATIERASAYRELVSRYRIVLPLIESELKERWGTIVP